MIEWLILLSCATWRISSLLYDEAGPWKMFIWLRERLGVLHDEDGTPVGYSKWAEILECFWCITIWVSLGLTIPTALLEGVSPWDTILLWLASSTGAILIEVAWMRRMRNG